MASLEAEQLKVQKEQKSETAKMSASIATLVKQGIGDSKDRVKLLKMQGQLEKSNRTLGGDLTKNVQDMKDGISTTIDGMVNETFGPIGGMVSSLTTGFFKRGKENRENITANEAQLDAAKDLIIEVQGGKVEDKATATSLHAEQKQTTAAVKNLPSQETQAEEELESDKQHAELLAALAGLKVQSIKDVGDDGGFFAGIGSIASILGGIALGLSAPGFFRIGQLTKAFENFKVKFPDFSTKFGSFFDDIALKTDSFKTKFLEKFKFPDLSTKLDEWKKGAKAFFSFDMPKLPDLPKMPDILPKFEGFKAGFLEFFDIPTKEMDATKDALKVINAADYGFDSVRIASETFGDTTKLVARDAAGRFAKVSDELKAAMVLADEGGDTGKVVAKARSFMGIELPGFMQKSIDKIDEVAKGADVAVDAAKTGGLAAKVGGIAKFLTVGVAGRALSIAGNPVFDAIAMGKDIFDIGSAMTDDDVKTAVQKEDLGAVLGGIIGGGIGFVLGGPAGAALGVGLGNMAGEFIGGMLDEPEILGAIKNVRDGLTAEKDSLTTDIADMQKQIDEGKVSGKMKEIMEAQIASAKTRVAGIDAELAEIKTLEKDEKDLQKIVDDSNAITAKKAELEAQLELAEEKGDDARVAFLENQITIQEKAFDDAQAKYDTASEKLRTKAQETTGALTEGSTSFFDRVATEGGFFGGLFSLFGGGLEGEAKKKYLAEENRKEIAELEAELAAEQLKPTEGGLFTDVQDADTIKEIQNKIATLKKEQTPTGKDGGFIVSRPTYLPNSGVIVGEHPTWSGKNLAARGSAGQKEMVIPFQSGEGQAVLEPFSQSIAGAVMNNLARDRVGLDGPAGMSSAPTVIDTSSQNVINNTTIVNSPEPTGPMLPGAGRDTAVSHFRHVA